MIVNFICNQIVAHFCISKTGHLRCCLFNLVRVCCRSTRHRFPTLVMCLSSASNRACVDGSTSTSSCPSTSVHLPSRNLAQNRQCRDTVTCLPAHNEQRLVKVVKVPIICTRSGSIVILLPPSHQQGSRNN